MADTILLKGIRLFKKKDNQPDFVLATGVITPDELNAFFIDNAALMTEYNGQEQIRIQVLISKNGVPYVSVDTWKPATQSIAGEPSMAEGQEAPDTGDLSF
jgi:hypothetical protein